MVISSSLCEIAGFVKYRMIYVCANTPSALEGISPPNQLHPNIEKKPCPKSSLMYLMIYS